MTEAEYLRAEAHRCRRWASEAGPEEAADLTELASEYEARAQFLEARSFAPAAPQPSRLH